MKTLLNAALIKDYKILTTGFQGIGSLNTQLAAHVRDGWVPSGEVFQYGDQQAICMIKYDPVHVQTVREVLGLITKELLGGS